MAAKWLYVLSTVMVGFVLSTAAPIESSRDKVDLDTELSKLKSLLHHLQQQQEAEIEQPPPLKHVSEPMVDTDDVDENVEDSDDDDSEPGNDVLERLAKSLSLADLRKLEAIKSILGESKTEKEDQDSKADDKDIEVETKEGTFGPFKDEIKYAIEKNLLSDVALAVHSGISVDDILADLLGKGTNLEEPVIWSKPVEE